MKNLVNYRYLKFLFFLQSFYFLLEKSIYIYQWKISSRRRSASFNFRFQRIFFSKLTFYDDVAGYYNLIPNIGLGIASFFQLSSQL